MRALPNMQVIVPSDPWQAARAVDSLVASPSPSYLRIDKSSAGLEAPSDGGFEIGVARTLRNGSDVTIIGAGGILAECISAAERLSDGGVSVAVIEMATIKPIDSNAILAAAARSSLVVTVEEHSVIGGLGGAVAEVMAGHGCSIPLIRIGLDDMYSSVVGSQKYLRSYYGMDASAIVDRVSNALAGNHAKAHG